MTESKGLSRWPVILTFAVVIVFTVVFAIEFISASQPQTIDPESLSAESYMDVVAPLIAQGDAARGEELVTQSYECYVCHIQGAGQTAPGFDGIATRAAEMRPPLTAEAYLYESIVLPGVHVVEGYPNSMPANYGTRISDAEMADILAYLLAQQG